MTKGHTMFEIQVPGSNGRTYTIKRAEDTGAWHCSCPAWKFSRVAPTVRTCKHIDALTLSLARYVSGARRAA